MQNGSEVQKPVVIPLSRQQQDVMRILANQEADLLLSMEYRMRPPIRIGVLQPKDYKAETNHTTDTNTMAHGWFYLDINKCFDSEPVMRIIRTVRHQVSEQLFVNRDATNTLDHFMSIAAAIWLILRSGGETIDTTHSGHFKSACTGYDALYKRGSYHVELIDNLCNVYVNVGKNQADTTHISANWSDRFKFSFRLNFYDEMFEYVIEMMVMMWLVHDYDNKNGSECPATTFVAVETTYKECLEHLRQYRNVNKVNTPTIDLLYYIPRKDGSAADGLNLKNRVCTWFGEFLFKRMFYQSFYYTLIASSHATIEQLQILHPDERIHTYFIQAIETTQMESKAELSIEKFLNAFRKGDRDNVRNNIITNGQTGVYVDDTYSFYRDFTINRIGDDPLNVWPRLFDKPATGSYDIKFKNIIDCICKLYDRIGLKFSAPPLDPFYSKSSFVYDGRPVFRHDETFQMFLCTMRKQIKTQKKISSMPHHHFKW